MPESAASKKALAGRGAIVTGASTGLGYAIAEAFVTAGANVFLCARTAKDLNDACARLSAGAAPGQAVIAVQGDVSREDDVARVVAAATNAHNIDILVNNAGVLGPIGVFDENPWADWVRTIEVDLLGSVLMCRFIIPHMRRLGRGKIIQLSGGGAAVPDPRFSAYAAA